MEYGSSVLVECCVTMSLCSDWRGAKKLLRYSSPENGRLFVKCLAVARQGNSSPLTRPRYRVKDRLFHQDFRPWKGGLKRRPGIICNSGGSRTKPDLRNEKNKSHFARKASNVPQCPLSLLRGASAVGPIPLGR